MKHIAGRSLILSSLIVIGAITIAPAATAGLPNDAQAAEWKALLSEYEEGMLAITNRIEASRIKYSSPSSDPTDRILDSSDIEKKLLDIDAPTRVVVMDKFMNAIHGHYGSKNSLIDTGGTKGGQPGSRPGYGDYDLEAPEEHIDTIKNQLIKMVSPSTVVDHGSYIEVEHLRLIVFKRRPIKTMADFDKISKAELDRMTDDKEIYLHLRLPKSLGVSKAADDAYKELATALEVQGHIKKGIEGALYRPPNQLMDTRNLEQLQSFAKSALKSIKAAGLTEEEVSGVLKSVGFAEVFVPKSASKSSGSFAFQQQINKLKRWAYLNPYVLSLTRENVSVFQKAVCGVLELADAKSQMMADKALKTLEALQKADPNDARLEPFQIAATLFTKQRAVNQAKLLGTPAADTLKALLEFFRLSDDYEIVHRNAGSPPIRTDWPGANPPGSAISAEATWRKFKPDERRKRGWRPVDQPGQAATIRIVIAEYRSERDAQLAYIAAISPESVKADEAAKGKEASEIKQAVQQSCAKSANKTTRTMLMDANYKGGTSHTEALGGKRTEVSSEALGKKAMLVSLRQLAPVIRATSRTRASRLTLDKDIKRINRNLPPVASFKCTTETSSAVINPGVPTHEKNQGVCWFGKCVVFVELLNIYDHATKTVDNNKIIHSDLSDLPEWLRIEQKFRRLTGRALPARISIALRMDGRDGVFKGVAADGISELSLIANISADEDTLNQISSAKWEVTNVPKSCAAGEVKNQGRIEIIGRGLRQLKGSFKPTAAVPREHQQSVRLVVSLKDGRRVVSKTMPFTVIPPPIIMIHGLWSDSRSMDPLREFLVQCGATTRVRCHSVFYGGKSTRSLLPNAKEVRKYVAHALQTCNQTEKIKVARVNIIAHSLGGLLARIVILGRPGDSSLKPDGDKVLSLITLATPHQGSGLADWYAEWNPALFTDYTDPSLQDFTDLRTHIRTISDVKSEAEASTKMREDAFEFGPAVLAMRAANNQFIDQLNRSQRTGSAPHIQYYCVAGTQPIISRDYARVAAVMIYNGTRVVDLVAVRDMADLTELAALDAAERMVKIGLSKVVNLAKYAYSAVKSRKFKQMVAEICDLISMPDTDGVVSPMSAIPRSVFGKQLGGALEVPEDHFGVIANPAAMSKVLEWLTEGTASPGNWSAVGSRSPGTLHLYDEAGRHVGRNNKNEVEVTIPGAVHVPYSDAMGDHEFIFLPESGDLRIEFLATEKGRVTVSSTRASAGAVTTHTLEDIGVQPKEKIQFSTLQPVKTAKMVASNGTEKPLRPVSYRLDKDAERPQAIAPAAGTKADNTGMNQKPIAAFSVMPKTVTVGDPVVAVCRPADPDGDEFTWKWLIDGQHIEEFNNRVDIELATLPAGRHEIQLIVRDTGGATREAVQHITVTRKAEPKVDDSLPSNKHEAYMYFAQLYTELARLIDDNPIEAPARLRVAYIEWDNLRKTSGPGTQAGGEVSEEAADAYKRLMLLISEEEIDIEKPDVLRDAHQRTKRAWTHYENLMKGRQ